MADQLGITIQFKGETTQFEKAVKTVNNEIKTTKSEISLVNKELKLDPTNVEKLTRKFELLKEKSVELAEKVKIYEDALKNMPQDKVGTKEWTDLNIQLNKAKAELASVNNELKNMPTANVQALSKKLEETSESLNKIGDRIESVGKKFMVLTGAITGLATAGVAYNAELEKQTTLFTTLTGSAEEAEKVLSAIKQDALSSPFDTQSLISANQYLMATGIEAEKSRDVIKALGNAISATGGGNSELQRMAQNLQQIQNVGKASTMDIRQFAIAGIDIYGILSESTGKTVKQLQEMEITFDMVSDALLNASQVGGKYYGAMEAQAETLNGKISKLKATFSELLGQLTEALMPVIKQVLDVLQGWIDKLMALDDGQKQTIVKIAGIVAGIGPLLILIAKLTGQKGIGGLLSSISKFLKSEKFVGWMAKVSTNGNLLTTVLKYIMDALTKLLNPITLVVAGFVLLYTKSETFRNAVNGLIQTILNALDPVLKGLKTIFDTLVSTFKTVTNTIGKLLEPIIKSLGSIIGGLIDVVSSLVSWISSKLNPVFELLTNIITLVLKEVKLLGLGLQNELKPMFDAIKKVVEGVKASFDTLINTFKDLYNKFADTSFGKAFTNALSSINGVISGLIDGFKNVINWTNEAINKTDQLIYTQDNAARYARSTNAPRSVMIQSDGLGIASGGIGLTANIHITNNGTPIDENEVRRWGDVMADEIDKVLGRRM